MTAEIPLSLLDLATVSTVDTPQSTLANSVRLAQLAESRGFVRHWVAEHHGMPGVASSSPEILIAHLAAHTSTIRLGSGGIMLPNHVPLKVAERFHTLEALHPGRIDLGIGRAPGTDQNTLRALRSFDPNHFPDQLQELRGLSAGTLPPEHPFARIRVMPDDVQLPPIWLLGSSGASAALAGRLGLGYAFASHFSPTDPQPALDAYRHHFEPSEHFPRPHIILAAAVIVADTDEEAQRLATSWDLAMVRLRRGVPAPFPTPDEALAYPYSPLEREFIHSHRKLQFIGTADHVTERLRDFVQKSGASELMIATFTYSHTSRARSLTLLSEAWQNP
ncbi:LLM class flavin-dependent oxidoreductase [Lujinxingia litoralis]|uniref:LLM class flavin-dependent oxidoreductase n=1 Tax=Lujinxingia litoralis TaxID=2211119 RepID=A0A328CB52_9DELT|nr:LLM class flavin-dependent oxidoreductase [Lujinxingia litoralis]RAL23003.1 LLM class flavin-dependent oxidoreductase [Lujinxingia litoralis]